MELNFTPSGARRLSRRSLAPAALCGLLLASVPVIAQDVVFTADGTIPGGMYHNVEIRPGVNCTVSGTVSVTGTFLVDSAAAVSLPGASLIDGSGLFRMLNDSKLIIGSADGIAGTTSGQIRTVTKDFGTKARITFSSSGLPQVTGLSFPLELSELVINNPFGVTMSRAISVRERLHLRNGSLITNGKTLTLISRTPDISGVTAASALIFNQNLTGRVVGNVTAQRYINPRYNAGTGYRHFSSSVTGSTVNDLQTPGFRPIINPRYNTVPYSRRANAGAVVPYPNVYFYEESQVGTGGTGTYNYVFLQGYLSPIKLTDTLKVTQGYTVRIPANQTVDFVGQPNNGTINTGPLTRGPLNESGWHLTGNPYPSKIDWTLLTRTNMFNQFSKYRSTSAYDGVYDTYVNGVSTGPSGNEFIAANQAVFTRVATANSVGSIEFDNSARLFEFRDDFTAPFFRGTSVAAARPLMRLAVEGTNDLHDEAVVYFEKGSTTGVDQEFDGFYINGEYPVGIYSQVGTENLSINGTPALSATTDHTIPFVVNTLKPGAYTINAQEVVNFPAGFQVLLQDAVTGITQDLTLNPVYAFSSTGNNANNTRFSVRFRAAGVTGLSSAITASGFEVYPNPSKGGDRLNILLPGIEANQNVQATMFNQIGQQVWTSTLHSVLGGVRQEVTTHLPQGVYTLQVTLPTGAKQSRRVVVN